ncbi:MAG: hypothetical protein LBU47_06785, partial [Christensenellaceae bacterium]|nr:hypothetical protein [Christensenellaceae bacterium]
CHCERQRSNPAYFFFIAPSAIPAGLLCRFAPRNDEEATQSSIFDAAFAHTCWIAASLRSSQ